jgi:hypothetical protein
MGHRGTLTGTFDPVRKDMNWRAALGPACNETRTTIKKLGRLGFDPEQPRPPTRLEATGSPVALEPEQVHILQTLVNIEDLVGAGEPSDDEVQKHSKLTPTLFKYHVDGLQKIGFVTRSRVPGYPSGYTCCRLEPAGIGWLRSNGQMPK